MAAGPERKLEDHVGPDACLGSDLRWWCPPPKPLLKLREPPELPLDPPPLLRRDA